MIKKKKILFILLKAVSFVSLLFFVSIIYLLTIYPNETLLYFWNLFIPIVPLIILISVGTWRNICPLALVYQLPQLFGFSLKFSYPNSFRKWSFYMAIIFLFILIISRKILLNTDATMLFYLLSFLILIVFFLGLLFSGKSGWCTSICPIYPIERLYGQKPLVKLKNCFIMNNNVCEKCTTRCFDKVKTNNYLFDIKSKKSDKQIERARKIFSGSFVGFVYGFFTVGNHPSNTVFEIYLYMALYSFISFIIFYFLIKIFSKFLEDSIISLFSIIAFNIYYFYTIPQSLNLLLPHYNTLYLHLMVQIFIVFLSYRWIKKLFLV